jgi:4-diphosphocytidyl-2C-methyl-D-erythritol kinase
MQMVCGANAAFNVAWLYIVVITAKAGIHGSGSLSIEKWIPVYAGMTN